MSSVPTVASLCASLGANLTPSPGFQAPDTEVTAVHISELLDPTAYLSGGELLLTTGLVLPKNEIGCRRYASRLVDAEVSALVLGLGPVHQTPPDPLVAACRETGLSLLTVPAPTPFLTVTRAYWTATSRATEQQLNDAVAAHRALVDAAVAPDPTSAILQRLSRVLGGWTALLDAYGRVEQVYPLSIADETEALSVEVARLEVAGVHSSVSFNIGDHGVVMFPLAVENRIVGYLAAGSPRRLDSPQRRVVLTAAALLSLDVVRGQRSESAREATRRCVALLVDLGLVEASRRLAAETDTPVPTQEVCVLAARGRNSDEIVHAVDRWCPEALAVSSDRSTVWFLLPDNHPDIMSLRERLVSADDSVTLILSDLVAPEATGRARARAQRILQSASPGQLVLPKVSSSEVVRRAVDLMSSEMTADLREAIVAYLRHRGQWEQASKALRVHRNTLRYRVGRARETLGVDIDDPDVAAEIWLALRARGMA